MIGESQPGSWPIQTPFDTSAMTVQPTEQCVQMFLRMVTCSAGGGRRAGFRLAHAAERQRAERGETASRKAGAAQEGAAVEAAFRLPLERASECAAASLTFCALDQHGPLLTSPDSG